MGETTAVSNSALQVSVSFGRFESESLSWEKWSTFSPNKYLEEVEKCATPGSVAEKKAYFEAHYKKIAARKAELLAEEKQAKEESFGSEDQSGLDLSGNSCGTDAELDISNTQDSIEGAKQETGSFGETEISRTEVDNLEEEVAVSRYCQSSPVKGENREPECRSHSSEQTDKPEEAICIKQEENLKVEAEYVKEISHVVYKEKEMSSQIEAKDVKLDHPKEHKVTFISNGAKTKKEAILPTSKSFQVSMPRSSKPTTKPTKTLASAASTKRGNSPSLPRRQATSTVESKNVSNKSLHMSLSLGRSKPDLAPHTTMRKSFIMEKMSDKDIASNVDPAPHTTMRKSFIMEKMGDKDIVKRAFKTFQNNVHQPKTFGEDRSLVKKQVPSRGTVPKVSTSTPLRKENGRATKVDSVDKRSGDSVRTSTGPKSDIRAEKGKESSRKIEDKSNAKAVERTRLQSKLKDEKEAEMKKLKHNFKATPLPAFYRGQKVSKSHQEKGDAKTENRR
ncbi:PREDICTED: protein WVD2-like 7 [Lupinus angustifolius]|uniref:protein WVD2-like 7 n=1 Tax=Lupinus angustifolius TaxID=3871 RepID=UPI00092E2075|nr:PREDICTED: protein WVD2-like 7 [Lupinus angustifolius]XP_019423602.1 PREDICTED: protein WVD2-like 7 [Lupinus angustifolius]XP_019423603.1 PREDICTED: protein WVD2-like 7 [Lupinus angustifolius]XP_019423604.1 PREDICTED: protein WVD2-like 7 [Lupinus angustifolius]XP_019423605.1 PREDICTED: protein WVD2-like 7 [Lupinus angustifolius]XP_019423606.1 PREDICTED: protein WVD2-like 7 [Lupinus angustifolius]XP_019423607.1 PREDICTED: protein WVD2-like 7 [Lupinus angustifolius]